MRPSRRSVGPPDGERMPNPSPQSPIELFGVPGTSDRAGYNRLYLEPDERVYIDYPEECQSRTVEPNKGEQGPTLAVALAPGTVVDVTRRTTLTTDDLQVPSSGESSEARAMPDDPWPPPVPLS